LLNSVVGGLSQALISVSRSFGLLKRSDTIKLEWQKGGEQMQHKEELKTSEGLKAAGSAEAEFIWDDKSLTLVGIIVTLWVALFFGLWSINELRWWNVLISLGMLVMLYFVISTFVRVHFGLHTAPDSFIAHPKEIPPVISGNTAIKRKRKGLDFDSRSYYVTHWLLV
jgi:hypothetical protein